jgi:hypothetical protein
MMDADKKQLMSWRVSGGDNAQRWVASIILTAIFCAVEINRSLRMGALALPTQYDDISYYLTGVEYLQTFHNSGLIAVLKAYIANPPHSPLSTGLAFLGFSLLGIKASVGPIANSVVFLVFVRWFFSFAQGINFFQAVLLAIAFFGFPFAALTVMSFRPDMFCSLLIACGTLFIVARPQWLTERRDQLVAGLILAMALWSKPTVFPLTLALFGAAVLLSSLGSLLRGSFKDPVRAALVTLGTGVLLSAPYYSFTLKRVTDYIWTTAFGSEAAIWVRPLSTTEHELFYLTGEYGRMSLGPWLYASIVIGICALLLLRLYERTLFRRSMLVLSLVVVTYLAVTIPSFKGPHGFPFAALIFVTAAVASVILVRSLPAICGWAISVLLVIFSAWQFSWPTPATNSAYVDSRWSMVRQALEAVGHDTTGKIFLLTTSGLYLNHSILAFEYYRAGQTPPVSDNTQSVGDMQEQRRRIELADIVFALTPDFTEVFPHLPTASPEFRAELIKAIEESGHFEHPHRISDPISGGAALIYLKRDGPAFSPFRSVEGLHALSGPYPQWNLPVVRWGYGKQSTLFADGTPGTRAKLVLSARAVGLPNQTLTVLVNGDVQLDNADMKDDFLSFEVPVVFNQFGLAEIVLRYGVASENAVLFKTIAIR